MEPIKLQNRTSPAPRTKQRTTAPDDTYADEGLYPVKTGTSAVRYTDSQGNQVIQRGNKRFVFHDGPPPKQRRRPHWLTLLGIGMILMLLLWAGLSWLYSWWSQNQLNATYEFPRISQADAVVYPGDTPNHPSHFLFINLGGTISIVEFQHGDPTHARVYKGPTLFDANADQVPVTGEFRVVNGRVEMLVHVEDKVILFVFDGKQFQPFGG